jgi:hypothetical protein
VDSVEPAAELERQKSRLREAGFEIASERGPDPKSFGNQVIELTRGALRVRLVRDRNQTWLSLATTGITDHDIGIWVSCMDDERPSLEVPDLEAEVALFLRRLPEFESFAIASGHETEDCLREAGEWRFSQRRSLGLIVFPGARVAGLTHLEQAVLDKLLAGDHRTLGLLRTQLERSRVSRREFTGVGFLTDFEVPEDAPAAEPRFSILGDVYATVDGLAHGAGFQLLVRDGRLVQLEGFTYDEPWPAKVGAFELSYIEDPRELDLPEEGRQPVIRFIISATPRRIDRTSSLVYLKGDHSFTARGPREFATRSVLVNDLELWVDGKGVVTVVDGYAPQESWVPTDEVPPPPVEGQVHVIGLPSDLGPGMSKRLTTASSWPSHFNEKAGWLCVGELHPPANTWATRIQNGVVVVTKKGRLVALWLPVQFETDSDR